VIATIFSIIGSFQLGWIGVLRQLIELDTRLLAYAVTRTPISRERLLET
jgi:hypothetical protein